MKGLTTVVVAFIVCVGFAVTGAAQSPEGNVQEGRKLFTVYGCYQCHGREAQGSAAGPRLARHQAALAGFTAYLRHPSGNMPPYTAKVLSDKDAGDVDAFLKSIPRPRAVKDLPLLNR